MGGGPGATSRPGGWAGSPAKGVQEMPARSFVRRTYAALGTVLLGAAAITAAASPAPTAMASTVRTTLPAIVAIRAAHHPGYDRIVFEFNRRSAPRASVGFVTKLYGDFSGQLVPVPGRAIIRVVITGAQAHTDSGRPTVATNQAFALPAIMALRGAGDFEAVVTLGIGTAARTSLHVHRLSDPGRIAVDVATTFRWSWRKVYFQEKAAFASGHEPYVRSVSRPIPVGYPATGLMDRLFAGPTLAERAAGLRFVASGATGFRNMRVENGIARVQLTGPCSSGGSTFTIADEILPTLKPLPQVSWVKIYDAQGHTEQPAGRVDSIPECLEP